MRAGERRAEGCRQLFPLMRGEEFPDLGAHALRLLVKSPDKTAVPVDIQFNPQPAPKEPLRLAAAPTGEALKDYLMGGNFDPFHTLRISEIDPESKPDERHIDAGETCYRPSAQEIERETDGEIHERNDTNDNKKASPSKGSVRSERHGPGFTVAFLHDPVLPKPLWLNQHG
jgi:hypothetical protein